MAYRQLPIPPHFDPEKAGTVWRVPYQQLAARAEQWAAEHRIPPAYQDEFRISLLLVDVQNTFCIPDFELYVAGRSGTAAVEDNRRLCDFIYRNLHLLTMISPTMDTHHAAQIFHSIFLVNDRGEHPAPFSVVTLEDVESGAWKFNGQLGRTLGIDPVYGQQYVHHYVRTLKEGGKYDLTIWPYHAMLGGIGHALVSMVEEAVFFHGMARLSQTDFQVKGRNPLTENYSVLSPEVETDQQGKRIADKNVRLVRRLQEFDAVIIAGQAKSHCVAWTIDDLLRELKHQGEKDLAAKVYLLEDCTSPVVIPEVVDYTEEADAAFERFADAGMHLVRSTEPMDQWPGMKKWF